MPAWQDLYQPWTWPGHLVSGVERIGGEVGSALNRGENEFRDVSQMALPGADERGQFLGLQGQGSANDFQGSGVTLRDFYNRQLRGQDSISALQLREAADRNIAQQMAMAASASPQNQALAMRTAQMQAGRTGAGLAGQQAMAGIAERQAAGQALGGLRQQDLQSALGFSGLELQNALGQLQAQEAIERARTARFNALLGVPTTGEQLLGFVRDAGQAAMTGMAGGV